MSFVMAYTLDGDATPVVKDFALDTLTNYQNGVGTNGVTKGDLVFLNAGLVRRAKDQATPPTAIGVLAGQEFQGLIAQGQPYAAANSSFTSHVTDTTNYPNGVGKIRTDMDTVYRVPVKSGQTAAQSNRGVAYGISQDATGDQTVDLTNTTNTYVKVLDVSDDGKSVFVVLKSYPAL